MTVGRLGARGRLDIGVVVPGELELAGLVQDLMLQLLHGAGRLDGELLVECPAVAVEGGEGLRVTARAIEGEHELSVHRLAQRMPGCRRLELADHVGVTPRGEIRLDPVLDARESKLLEVRSLDERERLGELC